MNSIRSFVGRFEFLSNFYPHKPNGQTVEHLFQAAKATTEKDRNFILAAPTPGTAKQRGRRVQLRPNWEEVKEQVMLDLLRQKFAPGSEQAERLLETGSVLLREENTWHDNYWGSCYCARCGNKGQNRLGELLMQVRRELREAS